MSNDEGFFNNVRPLFGGKLTQQQFAGLKLILAGTEGLSLKHRAYVLATSQHESAHTMQPVRETLANTDASAIARLENAWRKGQLKWVKTPYWRPDADGKSWFGRGYVQLTHKTNYAKAGAKLDLDLTGNPSLALRPDVAALVLVRGMVEGWFTARKLADFARYEDMRRVVNGTDRAGPIADLARGYERALKLLHAPAPAPEPAPAPTPRPVPAPVRPLTERAAAAGIGGAIALALLIAGAGAFLILN